MTNPFRFRPSEPEADVDHDGEVADWEDNALSNFFAWASTVLMPTWCQDEAHWTSRFATYLWTSCPCCLLFRGIALGLLIGLLLAMMFVGVVWLLNES